MVSWVQRPAGESKVIRHTKGTSRKDGKWEKSWRVASPRFRSRKRTFAEAISFRLCKMQFDLPCRMESKGLLGTCVPVPCACLVSASVRKCTRACCFCACLCISILEVKCSSHRLHTENGQSLPALNNPHPLRGVSPVVGSDLGCRCHSHSHSPAQSSPSQPATLTKQVAACRPAQAKVY